MCSHQVVLEVLFRLSSTTKFHESSFDFMSLNSIGYGKPLDYWAGISICCWPISLYHELKQILLLVLVKNLEKVFFVQLCLAARKPVGI